MRKQAALITLLQDLFAAVAEEADRNPAFAAKLDGLLAPLPEPKPKPTKKPALPEDMPDIHREWAARDEADFRAWLALQPLDVLRAIIRKEDLDPSRRAARWSKPDRFVDLIASGLRARSARGSAFLTG